MVARVANFAARWSLAFQRMKHSRVLVFLVNIVGFAEGWGQVKRFTVASFIVMLIGMAGIGWWIGEKIKAGVITETASTTALYMDSFIAPNVQELANSQTITPEHVEALNNLFSGNNLGQRTVFVKIWVDNNHVVYSNNPGLIGKTFPPSEDLEDAWQGKVTGEISTLEEEENEGERLASYDHLLEIYSPVRLHDTNQLIAVAEFYQKVDVLEEKIAVAQRKGWIVVGVTMLCIYLLLIGFVQWANNIIEQQKVALKNQVIQLTNELSHHRELNKRVRRAAANTVELNENLLRRTSAELHDGPVQQIGLALLRLDHAIGENEVCRFTRPNSKCNNSLPAVQTSLQTALQDLRAIASSLGVPQFDKSTLPEIISRAVHSHERRTGTQVTLNVSDNTPDYSSLPVKIASYRFIQEGLNNIHSHAASTGQEVRVAWKSDQIQIEVSDKGPGFNVIEPIEWESQLGLTGMRERVESLGGVFIIESKANEGTKLVARLFLNNIGDD